ncbi:hypothetical protein [Meridianimarinicoccus aquatilis]|uniref:Uncharacterized protein n=1 Tax=Meridianimarinicoccus aquatilis TaxID=2552766 RepID=A0A4R6AS30_9RHOB|nr:hypothetical protein [Fluviibacterium aquatile]TDL84593.1 hypothetical protein E2L05_17780 [Fluviibacterium aquatile]
MNIKIIASQKFHHSPAQYRADVEGFTLLRLTCGSSYGLSGGAIKTATVGDDGGVPVYPDQGALISAMKVALIKSAGSDRDLEIRRDSLGRAFGEITGKGSEDDCVRFFALLAGEMGATLSFNASNDMRDLYNDIFHTDGEAMYLSDGIYLEPDGELIER